MTKQAQIPLRTTKKLKSDIEALAKKDKRSTNQYIEIVLEEHVESEHKKGD